MAIIISLANGKGGVAKTTTSIALGSSLAKMGYRILLIDLDPSANLTAGLGILSEGLHDFSQDLFTPDRARLLHPLKTAYHNLDILPSKGEIAYQDGESFPSDSATTNFRNALETLPPDAYDLILLDCPASLGSLTFIALAASDWLIIPTQPEYFSTMVLPTMFSVVNKIRQGNNPGLQYRILVTMLDLRLKEHRDILAQLQMWLRDSLFQTRVQIDTHFKESQSQGIPINYVKPYSRGSLQYKDLAFEIVHDLKLTPPQREKVESHPEITAQSMPVMQDESPTSRSESQAECCPHLGLFDDPKTIQAYPSKWNRCYRASPSVRQTITTSNSIFFPMNTIHARC